VFVSARPDEPADRPTATLRALTTLRTYVRVYTAAAECLADDLDALVVRLRYLPRHRRGWRSTNLLERSLGEVKRRTR
jgi:hypothetical protein